MVMIWKKGDFAASKDNAVLNLYYKYHSITFEEMINKLRENGNVIFGSNEEIRIYLKELGWYE